MKEINIKVIECQKDMLIQMIEQKLGQIYMDKIHLENLLAQLGKEVLYEDKEE